MEIIGYDFGLILRGLRERSNLTQKQLGSKIGVSEGMISRYENNMSEPPFETVRDFAAIFNVSMDYLAGMEKQRSIPTTGLTEEQIDIMQSLGEAFHSMNNGGKYQLTQERYEILGKITAELFKQNNK